MATDYGPLYQAGGNQWGIDPLLLQSMANEESGENPAAVGPVIQSGPAAGQRALGFMQFLPGTAKQYSVDTGNPSSSVFGASNYMADLLYKENLPLRQALATYGGTAGNPNSGYVNTVMDRYKALKNAWSAGEPPPASDTDPNSPTYGQPTTRNLKPGAAAAPAVDTTAKGNAGQPGPNVPTTDTTPSVPGGISAAAPSTFAPPSAGGPKGQRGQAKAAPINDPLANLKPNVDEHGQPIETPSSAATVDDPLARLKPNVDDQGQPITTGAPIDTGEYLTAPTSPGAKAVGAQPTGTLITEGQVPGPAFQAKINVATDPAQKARIAASTLFPDDPNALDRIIIGPDGRMAAVGDQGQPYYIEPQRVLSSDEGSTKRADTGIFGGPSGTGVVGGPVAGDVVAITGTPGASAVVTDRSWQPTSPFWSSRYGAPFREPGNLTPSNLVRGGAAEIPNALTTGLSWAPAGAFGPIGGAAAVGTATAATEAVRQWLANRMDPNPLVAPNPVNENVSNDALRNAAAALGFRVGGALLRPAAMTPSGTSGSLAPTPEPGPLIGARPIRGGTPIEENPLASRTQFPITGTRAWPFTRGYVPESQPMGPSVPIEARPSVPGAVVQPGAEGQAGQAAPAVMLDPMEGAADKTGPYAATTQAEIRAQPTNIAPPRFPIMTRQQVEDRADEIVRHFASVGNTVPDTRPLITEGTLAQTTGNPGLAALERRVAADTPLGQTTFQAFRDAQLQARRDFTRNLVGTTDDLAALRQARDANTQETKAAAFGPGQTTPVDPQPVIDKIDEILKSPEGVRSAVADPLRQIRSWFYERDPVTGKVLEDAAGNPVPLTDPERLYNVRRDIQDSKRGPMATSTQTDARAAAHSLGDVEKALDDTITSGAPNYPAYMQQYADQSKGINAMEFLQGRNLTDANGDTTLAKVDGAIKAAERQRDVEVRRRPADALSDDQMQQLYTLRDDLRRQANSRKGMDIGSPTVQNFSTSATYNALAGPMAARLKMLGAGALGVHTGGLSGILWGAAEPFIENALTGPSRRTAQAVDEAVIRRLLNRDGSGTRALQEAASQTP